MAERWHPVQTLVCLELMFPKPGLQEPYARISLIRVNGELGWKVTLWEDREIIHRGPDLEKAAAAAHRHYTQWGDGAPPSPPSGQDLHGMPPVTHLARDGRKFREDRPR